MKEYKSKYGIGAEVYILNSKKIIKAPIKSIKIIDVEPYIELTIINNEQVLTPKSGLTIEYLIETDTINYPGCKGTSTNYDWFKEEDVFDNKEELIRQIK